MSLRRSASARPSRRPLWMTVFSSVLAVTIVTAGLFAAAGRLDWRPGWLALGLAATVHGLGFLVVARRNPGLLSRRARVGHGTPLWDLVMLVALGVTVLAAALVAGLDSGRYGWSTVPTWVWLLAAATYALGGALAAWAMAVNPHFEKTVRIQTDRGHRVVARGPYRFVRHPGYTGFTLCLLAGPVVLASWWALLPAVLASALLALRTALEDRLLRYSLPGYAAYARRVRRRLFPGVW